ncbi:MAG: hypothetical protein WC879_18325 [Melioribacteraceae bacterium]
MTQKSYIESFFLLFIVTIITSCSNRQAEIKHEEDLLFEIDSAKVFSRDLSYYDPNKPEIDYKNRYNFPRDLENWYNSLVYKMKQSPSDSIRYFKLVARLRQFPVFVEMSWGDKKEMKNVTVPYGVYLDYIKTIPAKTISEPCNKDAAVFILSNMTELCSSIDREKGKYYILHDLWGTCNYEKKLKLITSVADAHACIEGKAREIIFIDDLTGAKIAKASPTLGIKVLDEESK